MANEGNPKKFLQEALDELKAGQEAIAERQKHIRIADQSEYHWRTVEAHKVGGLGDDDEDAKRIKEVERDVAQQINRDKKKPVRERRPQPPSSLPQCCHSGHTGHHNCLSRCCYHQCHRLLGNQDFTGRQGLVSIVTKLGT